DFAPDYRRDFRGEVVTLQTEQDGSDFDFAVFDRFDFTIDEIAVLHQNSLAALDAARHVSRNILENDTRHVEGGDAELFPISWKLDARFVRGLNASSQERTTGQDNSFHPGFGIGWSRANRRHVQFARRKCSWRDYRARRGRTAPIKSGPRAAAGVGSLHPQIAFHARLQFHRHTGEDQRLFLPLVEDQSVVDPQADAGIGFGVKGIVLGEFGLHFANPPNAKSGSVQTAHRRLLTPIKRNYGVDSRHVRPGEIGILKINPQQPFVR